MEILKHKGLDHSTYEQCCQLAEKLPANSIVKHRLRAWLSRHIDIQRQLSLPLVVSSDIIESLFGNFKLPIRSSAARAVELPIRIRLQPPVRLNFLSVSAARAVELPIRPVRLNFLSVSAARAVELPIRQPPVRLNFLSVFSRPCG